MTLILLVVACATPLKPLTVADMLELGEKYLIEHEYEQALVQFLTVIEVEPMIPRGYTGAAEAYIGLDQLDNAMQILSKALTVIGDDSVVLNMINELSPVVETTPEPTPLPTPEPTPEPTPIPQYIHFLDAIQDLLDADDIEGIQEIVRDYNIHEFSSTVSEIPFIHLNEAGNYGIGIYEDGFVYIGSFLNGQRSGYGSWTDGKGYIYVCEWLNDLPNGHGITYVEEGNISGTLVDGLWNGVVIYDIAMHNLYYTVNYDNGRLIPIEKRRDGWWVIAHTADRSTVSMPGEAAELLDGVLPFSER